MDITRQAFEAGKLKGLVSIFMPSEVRSSALGVGAPTGGLIPSFGLPNSARRISVRNYQHDDKVAVRDLLVEIPTIYPGGLAWLERRLDDVEQRKAQCMVALDRNVLVGVTIDSPKGRFQSKLSTIYVADQFRRKGVGSLLLASCVTQWIRKDIERVHVTVDERRVRELLVETVNKRHGK